MDHKSWEGKTVYGLAYAMMTGGALSAFTLGLAAPAMAAPSGIASEQDTVTASEQNGDHTVSTTQGLAPLDQCWLPSVRRATVVNQTALLSAKC
jgi:hypothetical protein